MKKCFNGTITCTALMICAALVLGTAATPASAQDKGACCLPDGGCEDDLSSITCGNLGAYQGNGSSCADNCPDCDCDGDSDVKEIAECVAKCVSAGGDASNCALACDTDSDGVPNDCAVGNNCDDEDSCTIDSCGGDGKCDHNPQDCSDGLDCTTDTCEGVAASETQPFTCVSTPVTADCADPDKCSFVTCVGLADGFDSDSKTIKVDCGNDISTDLDDAVCVNAVAAGGAIVDLDVELLIAHTWRGDLTITLSHGGTDVVLYDGPNFNPGGSDNLGDPDTDTKLTFNDKAARFLDDGVDDGDSPTGMWKPREALSAFFLADKSGDWTLTVNDAFAGDDGVLVQYGLVVEQFEGGCLFLELPEVNDGLSCTNDSCDPATGDITNDPVDGKCDDGVRCTVDTCEPDEGDADGCVFTTDDDDCDDTNPCTVDVCTGIAIEADPDADPEVDKDNSGCVNTDIPDKDGDGCCDEVDPCPNDPKIGCDSNFDPDDGDCTEVMYRAIIRSEKSGLNSVPNGGFLPDADTVHLQNGCFVIEVWVQERTEDKTGIACAFADFAWKGAIECQPKWTLFNGSDTFDQFNTALKVDNNSGKGTNLGGCTLLQGVGIFPAWHRLGTLHYDGNHPKCKNVFNLEESEKGASLMNVGEAKVFQFVSALLDIECLGFIYDLAPENSTTGQPEIQVSDFALFAPCWMAGGDGDLGDCADVDWDCDGVVGPGDLNFFATAWQKEVCEPNIAVPACQLHCDTDATSTGQGTLTNRGDYLPWATRQTIREFGLPVPPRDWAGWALDPSRGTDGIKTRRGARRGTR